MKRKRDETSCEHDNKVFGISTSSIPRVSVSMNWDPVLNSGVVYSSQALKIPEFVHIA